MTQGKAQSDVQAEFAPQRGRWGEPAGGIAVVELEVLAVVSAVVEAGWVAEGRWQ